MNTPNPTLLTPDEAAAIARCSVKTVRRAYAAGALTAYRRRGSRAVLLDNKDVLTWAQGQILQPTAPNTRPPIEPTVPTSPGRKTSGATDPVVRAQKVGSQRRFDLSPAALGDRRSSKTHYRR